MDLITQLLMSNGYDAILTIVDHGCTRAALFLPCKTTITGAKIAQLYFDNVYQWFGLPKHIISDRDPHNVTLHIFKLTMVFYNGFWLTTCSMLLNSSMVGVF
jgi:hypothetical protein